MLKGSKHSPESLEKMRLISHPKGKDHPMWGYKHSPETRAKMRINNHPSFLGRHHTPETIETMMVMNACQRSEVIDLYRSGLTGSEISLRLGIGKDPVYYWLKKSKIEMRNPGFRRGRPSWNGGLKFDEVQKAKLNLSGLEFGRAWNRGKVGVYSPEYLEKLRTSHTGKNGEKSSNWKGGLSFEPYSHLFNRQLKDTIRARDNFICQKCGVLELEYGRRLGIHHIDYDKKNCTENNLISLCTGCNGKVNGDREYWKEFFNKKMEAIF